MDCAAYPKRRRYVVFNNTGEKQSTVLYDGKGNKSRVTLKPYESKWFAM
jgi:1,3-beta-galactosyl-N-acetylhexosamine phosphorylase